MLFYSGFCSRTYRTACPPLTGLSNADNCALINFYEFPSTPSYGFVYCKQYMAIVEVKSSQCRRGSWCSDLQLVWADIVAYLPRSLTDFSD